MRRLAVFLSLVAVLLAGCDDINDWFSTTLSYWTEQVRTWVPGRAASDADAVNPSAASSQPRTILTVPPEEMREFVTETYRLKPDRRFLLGVATLHHFLTGEKETEPTVAFRDGHWWIRYADMEVGTLPPIPDFPDGMRMLQDWANRLTAKFPLRVEADGGDSAFTGIDANLDRFLAPSIAAAARDLDARWQNGARDTGILPRATRALVDLTLQQMDVIEVGDRLPAKAMAVLALTQTVGRDPCTREESLLAYSMGYTAHATRTASSLDPADPVRLYVTHQDEALAQAAEGGSAEVQYLYLSRLVDLDEEEPALDWIEKHFSSEWLSLPILKSLLDLRPFSLMRFLSEAAPRLALVSLAGDVGIMPQLSEISTGAATAPSERQLSKAMGVILIALAAEKATLVGKFESGTKILDARYPGPFLDSETYRAYYNSYFYSSYYLLGLFYLDNLSSTEAVKDLSAEFGTSGAGLAGDFERWYALLAASKAGNATLENLSQGMTESKALGVPPLMRILKEQQRYLAHGDAKSLEPIKEIADRMDTRVSHRVGLLDLSSGSLLDLRLAESLRSSILQAAPEAHGEVLAWEAHVHRDVPKLKAMVNDPSLGIFTRMIALRYVVRDAEKDRAFIGKAYESLITESPDHFRVYDDYARYLLNHQQYGRSRETMRRWLKRGVWTTGLEEIEARTLIAETYEKEGRLKEAWREVGPAVKSWKADAMIEGAQILDQMGRKPEAEKLAGMVAARYPDDIGSRLALASMYWRHGKYAEAAASLKATPQPLRIFEWQFEVAPVFVETFSDKSREETLQAFDALLRAQVGPFELFPLVYPIAKKGNYELAFDMVTRLHYPGPGNLVFLGHGYEYLKELKGKDAALQWMRSQTPMVAGMAAMALYEEKHYDLLWDLIPTPVPEPHADFVWLMRAAASLQVGPGRDPHRAELEAYYRSRRGGYYDAIGRYLMGMTNEKDVLGLVSAPDSRCEVAYYLGLKAESEGRFADASDWYRVTVETGLTRNHEHRWALNTLYLWAGKDESLDRLAAGAIGGAQVAQAAAPAESRAGGP
jgi:hypothetical protein